jgi:hypothetical protein
MADFLAVRADVHANLRVAVGGYDRELRHAHNGYNLVFDISAHVKVASLTKFPVNQPLALGTNSYTG